MGSNMKLLARKEEQTSPLEKAVQHPVDGLERLEDVVGGIHEEVGDHGILTGEVLGLRVHFQEVSGGHREARVPRSPKPGSFFPPCQGGGKTAAYRCCCWNGHLQRTVGRRIWRPAGQQVKHRVKLRELDGAEEVDELQKL